MKIENAGSAPRLTALARSETATPPPGDASIQKCPYAHEEPAPAPKTPLRVMMWNILELGGGFYQPAVRPAYAIDSYATLINALKIDICAILGISSTVGAVPAPAEKGADDLPNQIMVPAVANTGVTEVLRILDKLKTLDSAGAWEAKFLKADETDEYIYHEKSTTCFLLRTAAPLTLTKLDVIKSGVRPKLGLTGKLVCATLQADTYKSGPLHVIAPLGTLNPRRPAPKAGPSGEVEGPAATMEFPDSALVALSAPNDLFSDHSAFSDFKTSVHTFYTMPATDGSLLRDDFWKTAGEREDDLLTNFAAVGLDDILLQNQNMYWSAMDEPAHPSTLPQVKGYLADTLLVTQKGSTGRPTVQEMRVVDLIKASLAAGRITELQPEATTSATDSTPAGASFPKEDAVLEAARAESERGRPGPEPEADPVNELAECRYFSRALSTHWPVVAQLQWT